jgi:hypothetical protein
MLSAIMSTRIQLTPMLQLPKISSLHKNSRALPLRAVHFSDRWLHASRSEFFGRSMHSRLASRSVRPGLDLLAIFVPAVARTGWSEKSQGLHRCLRAGSWTIFPLHERSTSTA